MELVQSAECDDDNVGIGDVMATAVPWSKGSTGNQRSRIIVFFGTHWKVISACDGAEQGNV